MNGPFLSERAIYLRLLTMNCEVRLLLRVLAPLVGLPHGVTGWRPPDVLPSPPPWGWSTGFMTTPRTVGRLPFQRIRPALPQLMLDCSALPTSPTVARHRTSTLRISPDGIRSWACGPSLATSWTLDPADRAIFAPPPGRSSMACTTVPTGMLRSGRLLRSEEHTSELQSRPHLVCRLLLEKKKNKKTKNTNSQNKQKKA